MHLDHVVFPVRDPDATLRFYRDVLRLPLVEAHSGADWGGFPWLMMIFGLPTGQEIVCVALRGAVHPDYKDVPRDARHYAVAVSADAELQSWRSHLRRQSVDFWEEDHEGRRSIYFSDPDGVILELTYPPAPARVAENQQALERARAWRDGSAGAIGQSR